MVKTKWNKDAPKCINGKRHQWKKGEEKYQETGICARCGYDVFDNRYRNS